ncbi:hypothetical protein [Streptomyces sp. NP160]|nr:MULTISPECIES: hypothetical protein [Actinomycetes]
MDLLIAAEALLQATGNAVALCPSYADSAPESCALVPAGLGQPGE